MVDMRPGWWSSSCFLDLANQAIDLVSIRGRYLRRVGEKARERKSRVLAMRQSDGTEKVHVLSLIQPSRRHDVPMQLVELYCRHAGTI